MSIALSRARELAKLYLKAPKVTRRNTRVHFIQPERTKMTLRFTIINLTNKNALYNFESTFSGKHFISPRVFEPSPSKFSYPKHK